MRTLQVWSGVAHRLKSVHPGCTYAKMPATLVPHRMTLSWMYWNLPLAKRGCLVIKCPFSINKESLLELTPLEVAKRYQTFCLHVTAEGELKLRPAHSCSIQAQDEMAILEVSWCDFIVYIPAGLHVERLRFDRARREGNIFPCLAAFFWQHILPVLAKVPNSPEPANAMGWIHLPVREATR